MSVNGDSEEGSIRQLEAATSGVLWMGWMNNCRGGKERGKDERLGGSGNTGPVDALFKTC